MVHQLPVEDVEGDIPVVHLDHQKPLVVVAPDDQTKLTERLHMDHMTIWSRLA